MSESVHAFFQCLTRDLTLSMKTVSATLRAGEEEDFVAWSTAIGLPIRTFAADSCASDKYDMPSKVVIEKRPLLALSKDFLKTNKRQQDDTNH